MRILVTVPHFYGPTISGDGVLGHHGSQCEAPATRAQALASCIVAFHQLFGPKQHYVHVAERRTVPLPMLAHVVHIVVCTVPERHLIRQLQLDESMFQHQAVEVDPRLLGFSCHGVLRDRWGNYDYYCYVEDDLVLWDPWFFRKLDWFSRHVGDNRLLLPNRFERGCSKNLHKLYIDGDLAPQVTAPFQDVNEERQLRSNVLDAPVVFRRPLNPHSGSFFLNARQMQTWINSGTFLDRDISFVGPLESAATLGIMKQFKIYKPAEENADFLEIEHIGGRFIRQIRYARSSSEQA